MFLKCHKCRNLSCTIEHLLLLSNYLLQNLLFYPWRVMQSGSKQIPSDCLHFLFDIYAPLNIVFFSAFEMVPLMLDISYLHCHILFIEFLFSFFPFQPCNVIPIVPSTNRVLQHVLWRLVIISWIKVSVSICANRRIALKAVTSNPVMRA